MTGEDKALLVVNLFHNAHGALPLRVQLVVEARLLLRADVIERVEFECELLTFMVELAERLVQVISRCLVTQYMVPNVHFAPA